eukprot:46985-Chlamydomonas_euryale.AAC.1
MQKVPRPAGAAGNAFFCAGGRRGRGGGWLLRRLLQHLQSTEVAGHVEVGRGGDVGATLTPSLVNHRRVRGRLSRSIAEQLTECGQRMLRFSNGAATIPKSCPLGGAFCSTTNSKTKTRKATLEEEQEGLCRWSSSSHRRLCPATCGSAEDVA